MKVPSHNQIMIFQTECKNDYGIVKVTSKFSILFLSLSELTVPPNGGIMYICNQMVAYDAIIESEKGGNQ